MHLGNGAITPECVAITYGAAAAGLAVGAASARRAGLTRDKLLIAAGLGSLVFAAQAIDVPVWPGISGHLVGGVLLASILGPGLGAWTMAIVLAAQALVLGDGGVAAWGANVINMALLPAGVFAAVTHLRKSESPVTLGFAAALAVPIAAMLIVAETALFRPAAELGGWANFAALMMGTHVWIGGMEGLLTGAVIAAVSKVASRERGFAWRAGLAWVTAGLLLAAAMVPFSSALPDGYEAAAQNSGVAHVLIP